MRALGVNFIASWKVTFMNLSLVITGTLTGGHCRGHEVVPDVVVVVGGAFALSPPSWQTPHEDLKLFSFGSSPVLPTPAEKIPLSTRRLFSFC